MQAVLYFIRSEIGSQWICCWRGVQFCWRGALRIRRAAECFGLSASVKLQSWECPREDGAPVFAHTQKEQNEIKLS